MKSRGDGLHQISKKYSSIYHSKWMVIFLKRVDRPLYGRAYIWFSRRHQIFYCNGVFAFSYSFHHFSACILWYLQVKQPILFLSGLQDEMVPSFHMEMLYAKAAAHNQQCVFEQFPTGMHMDTWLAGGDHYWRTIQRFLEQNVPVKMDAQLSRKISSKLVIHISSYKSSTVLDLAKWDTTTPQIDSKLSVKGELLMVVGHHNGMDQLDTF